jgi:protein TonB
LDTKDKRYVPYAKLVKARLMQNWKYPEEALDKLIEGKLLALFSLDRQGRLLEIEIIQLSGFEVLDREAIRAIRASAAFPPFPSSVTVSRLNIEASFDYRLTSTPANMENRN